MIDPLDVNGNQNLLSYNLKLEISRNELQNIIRDAVKQEFEIRRAQEEFEKWINRGK